MLQFSWHSVIFFSLQYLYKMADFHKLLCILFFTTIFLTVPEPGTTQAPVNCPRDTSFLCGNGQCVPNSARCNRYYECDDGTDEIGCPPPQPCSSDQQPCEDGTCIFRGYFCDGRRDCPDGSDERTCGKYCFVFILNIIV